MKYLLLVLALIPRISLAQTDCEKHPIFCDIVKLRPSIDKKFAMQLSNYIYKYSREFETDPKISVAIAMQESSLRNVNRMGTILTKDGRVVYGATDVGVFQIHVQTIANMQSEGHDIDLQRLESDIEYQTMWHAKILKRKIRVCQIKREKLKVAESKEWSCYHSYTFSLRSKYLRLVSRHLKKLSSI